MHTSLALDNSGHPHISYYDRTDGDLRYARWDGTAWQVEIVDSQGDTGKCTALALDAGGRAHVSYYDVTNGELRYARRDGEGWYLESVDSAGDVGKHTSLALDREGRVHVSYYDYTLRDLKYALGAALTTISVYTDQASYSAGETMHFGLDLTTAPGGPLYQSYWLLVLLRAPGTGVVVLNHPGLALPSGWSYSNSEFFTWTLPALVPGSYTWIAMLVPMGAEPAMDYAVWEFVGTAGTRRRVVPVDTVREHLGDVRLDLGE